MQIKLRAWDKVNNRMQSWEDLLSGKEFKAKLQDPEAHGMVLMMWTGLKDKNGVEIFEGDIVARGKYKYEVAGNIYENPELMEKNQPSERELKTTEKN